jgi:hypothetical protein
MDVARDQEHDGIHLRDLLTCSARSLVSPVRGSESGGFSAPKNTNEGLGASFTAIQRYAIQETSQTCLKHAQAHPKPVAPAPRLRGMKKLTPPSSESPQRGRLRRRAWSPERRRFQPPRPEYASSRVQPQDVRAVTTHHPARKCETCGITDVTRWDEMG